LSSDNICFNYKWTNLLFVNQCQWKKTDCCNRLFQITNLLHKFQKVYTMMHGQKNIQLWLL